MAYFDTKSGSLEEAVRQAVSGQQIDEKEMRVFRVSSNKLQGNVHAKDEKEAEKIFRSKGAKGKITITDRGPVSKMPRRMVRNEFEIEEKLDPVNKKAVKKDFDDRKDKDIDNDGDVDSTDKYLHKRRKAVSKAIAKDEGNTFGKALKDAREKGEKTFVVSGKTYNVEDYQSENFKDIGGYMVTAGPGDNNQKIIGNVKTEKEAMKIRDDYNKKNNPEKNSDKARVFAMRGGFGDIANRMKVGDKISYSQYSQKRNFMKLKENNELGTPENTKAKLDATPGQSPDEWQQQVDTMKMKNMSMREALAKMWDVDEGHNPFKKEEKAPKKEAKTMTGKPMTKVTVDPDMKEKVKTETAIGKKNIK